MDKKKFVPFTKEDNPFTKKKKGKGKDMPPTKDKKK